MWLEVTLLSLAILMVAGAIYYNFRDVSPKDYYKDELDDRVKKTLKELDKKDKE